MIHVSELSDKELRTVLSEHGKTPGPITATTRRVYELQLESLIKQGGATDRVNKRRQTLDTLRSTEKPKLETRRSEGNLSSRPHIPALLNLSDYSDTELPELTAEPETPAPPRNLVFSSSSPTRRKPIKTRDSRDPTLFSDTEDEKTSKKTKKKEVSKSRTCEVVSIVVGVIVAMVVVGVAYYLIRGKPASSMIAPQCLNLTFDMTLVECDRIYTELLRQKRELDLFSGDVRCGDKEGDLHIPAPYSLSERQLVFHLREDLNYSIFIRREDAYIQLEGEAELDGFNPVDTVFFYSTQTPHISWYCFVSTLISNFAFYILTVGVLLVIAQIAHKVYQWKRAKLKQETGQMYELIDQIIEELQRNYTKYLGDPINHVPYVAIPHARDRLLLPSERAAMKNIWDKAVQFIAQHESRVRVEMRRVQSEDFPVWYWLEASKSPQPQPDSTSPDFLYPDLDSEISSVKHKEVIGC